MTRMSQRYVSASQLPIFFTSFQDNMRQQQIYKTAKQMMTKLIVLKYITVKLVKIDLMGAVKYSLLMFGSAAKRRAGGWLNTRV